MKKGHIKTILTTIVTFVFLRSIFVFTEAATKQSFIQGMCRASDWYTKRQRRICTHRSPFMKWVKTGVENALKECRRVMKNEKWNCSPLQWNDVFQKYGILKKISRETAFVQAITAAGVMHHVAKGCIKKDEGLCPCRSVIFHEKTQVENFDDKFCSDDFKRGADFSKLFMDPKPKSRHYDRVQAHNQEVGRRVVRLKRRKLCTCHGTSNGCTTKTCWYKVPAMSLVADTIWERLGKAVRSKWDPKKQNLVRRSRRNEVIKKNQLSFINNSPDFCKRNDSVGIMGTVGRSCHRGTDGINNCNKLCCGRKVSKKVEHVEKSCNCQLKKKTYVVKCQRCKVKKVTHTCL